jgi:hypothetical protein
VRQIEAGQIEPRRATIVVVRQAFERAGVEFIDENGGGPGVRLRKRQRGKWLCSLRALVSHRRIMNFLKLK